MLIRSLRNRRLTVLLCQEVLIVLLPLLLFIFTTSLDYIILRSQKWISYDVWSMRWLRCDDFRQIRWILSILFELHQFLVIKGLIQLDGIADLMTKAWRSLLHKLIYRVFSNLIDRKLVLDCDKLLLLLNAKGLKLGLNRRNVHEGVSRAFLRGHTLLHLLLPDLISAASTNGSLNMGLWCLDI